MLGKEDMKSATEDLTQAQVAMATKVPALQKDIEQAVEFRKFRSGKAAAAKKKLGAMLPQHMQSPAAQSLRQSMQDAEADVKQMDTFIESSIRQQLAYKNAVAKAEGRVSKASAQILKATTDQEENKDKQAKAERELALEQSKFPELMRLKKQAADIRYGTVRSKEIEQGTQEWVGDRARASNMTDDYAEKMTQWRLKGGVKPEMPAEVAEEAAFWDTSKPSGARRFQQQPMQFASTGQQLQGKEQSMQKYLSALARLTEEDIGMFSIMTAQIEALQKDIENLKGRVNTNRAR